jgi:hypothetical protein
VKAVAFFTETGGDAAAAVSTRSRDRPVVSEGLFLTLDKIEFRKLGPAVSQRSVPWLAWNLLIGLG